MQIIRKDAPVTVTSDDMPGSFEAILSAPTLDRDGEILLADEWKMPLPDRITVDVDHGMTVASTIGSAKPWIDDDGNLRITGTFASTPKAQEVRTLMKEGHINTTSVAFMSEKTQKGEKTVVLRELLNAAVVAIPSNREALVLASKALKAGARNSKSDAEMIQSMHDTAGALGADCSKKSAVDLAEVKSIIGSLEATQDRATDALEDQYGQQLYRLRGTLPDVLIFDLFDADYDVETYRQTYEDDGSVITLTGSAEPVDVAEVVTPDADAFREDKSHVSTPLADKATGLESSDEADEIVLRAHALAIMAQGLAPEEGD